MQVDPVRYALYEKEAPELLKAVTSGEAEHIMARDPATDYCVKFENGLCGIHKTRGTAFLGDTCHFFPRVTRRYGDTMLQSAALSCPEITRLTLYGDAPFAPVEIASDRIPVEIRDYLPEGLTGEQCMKVTRAFVDACDDAGVTAERVLMRIITAAHSLHMIAQKDWPDAAGFMLRTADSRLVPPEPNDFDNYRLAQILEALVGAAKPVARPRLDETRQAILHMLEIRIAANSYDIISATGSFTQSDAAWQRWNESGARAAMDPILKRWIQAQITMSGLPFAGFGRNLPERATILAVRFATLRLALMSAMGEDGTPPSDEAIVRIVQGLSRFLDHLSDPQFSILAYHEAGWLTLGGLRGLIRDL